MSSNPNTLFLRLAGPMQSWGTSSQLQIRRTDECPSKSGVLGIVLCAMGISREDSRRELQHLQQLTMGVRIDRGGDRGWDYHTTGAKFGILSADGKIKNTASTGEPETQLSRRQYLYDASFLVALQGPPLIIESCANALEDPVWPVFLGRKSCVPSEPVFSGLGCFVDLSDALSSLPWQARPGEMERYGHGSTRTLDAYTELPAGSTHSNNARLVYDVPRVFGFHSHGSRWLIADKVTVKVEISNRRPPSVPWSRRPDYQSAQWRAARSGRLVSDDYLCVFCKSEAQEVHHVTYENVGSETNDDLRSLCKVCHDACTMLEYGRGLQLRRIDPSDPSQREEILGQINRILTERRLGRRRELLEKSRLTGRDFFEATPST
ncbi:MAG: type I-E CRISPR-associated protein Cas5/CasD [Chloroflexi bacterium]|nr:type I-E CRISPR-associated protein Cas5/CasD [Chloroflexota bacterium]